MRAISLLTLALALAMGTAHAGVLDLNISNPVQTGQPGDTFTFQGTITNNTPNAEDENSLFQNFANFDFINLTIVDLLSSQTFTINPGDTSAAMSLFQIMLDPAAPLGTYTADAFLQDLTGFTGDSVTVTIDAVPEPATLLLAPLGAGLLLLLRRRSN